MMRAGCAATRATALLGVTAMLSLPVGAESLVATRTLRAATVIGPEDIALVDAAIPGALTSTESAIGRETRVSIYAGRPIRAADLGAPALIERNQLISIRFVSGALSIEVEGRALARGGAGDDIRVMNLASRTTVTGRVTPEGLVVVGPNP
jgi:flagella basal body P-ring formation protein FlgA